MSWRPARCIPVLLYEVNTAYPNRDHGADGVIGDAAHQAEHSDHNPDANGVVHAVDIDADGIPAGNLAQKLVDLGRNGDPRLQGNGYVIWNRQIASASHRWVWRHYDGSDAHTDHIHLSVSLGPTADLTYAWNVFPHTPNTPNPVPVPEVLTMDFFIVYKTGDPGRWLWFPTIGGEKGRKAICPSGTAAAHAATLKGFGGELLLDGPDLDEIPDLRET